MTYCLAIEITIQSKARRTGVKKLKFILSQSSGVNQLFSDFPIITPFMQFVVIVAPYVEFLHLSFQ